MNSGFKTTHPPYASKVAVNPALVEDQAYKHNAAQSTSTSHANQSASRPTSPCARSARKSGRLPRKKQQSLPAAFRCAALGIFQVFLRERNLKIHITALILMVILGLICQLSLLEWAVLVFTAAFVLALECMNAAIEAVVDLVSPDYHELAGLAKDAAAGAVFIAALASLLIAAFIFIPALISRFFT